MKTMLDQLHLQRISQMISSLPLSAMKKVDKFSIKTECLFRSKLRLYVKFMRILYGSPEESTTG